MGKTIIKNGGFITRKLTKDLEELLDRKKAEQVVDMFLSTGLITQKSVRNYCIVKDFISIDRGINKGKSRKGIYKELAETYGLGVRSVEIIVHDSGAHNLRK